MDPLEQTVRKNIEDAKAGLFGNASAEVLAKNQATLDNITGKNKTPVYTGTGSSYDKAIDKKVSERNSGSKKASGNLLEYYDNSGTSGGSMMPILIGAVLILLLLRR